jgi:hypothetical protein
MGGFRRVQMGERERERLFIDGYGWAYSWVQKW